jgi:N-acetylneuraminic acid mutarotase
VRSSTFGIVTLLLVSLWPVGAHHGREASDWKRIGLVPVARSELGAAAIGSSVYVVGGFGGGDRIDRFDTETGLWTNLRNMPEAVHHPGVAALDGRIYVAGGYPIKGTGVTNAFWSYSPVQDEWTKLADLPTARGALGLTALVDHIYAVGGAKEHLGGPVSGAVEAYDPATDTWQSRAEMITPREHLAVAAADGALYAIGGRANGDEDEKFSAANERYDPVANQWTQAAKLPVPRAGLSGVVADGKIIVLGGELFRSGPGPKAFDSVNLYNPRANSWTSLPPMPTARHGLASAWVGSTLYAITGSTKAGVVENTPIIEALTIDL